MDDSEYYEKMRNHNLNRNANLLRKKSPSTTSNNANRKYTEWKNLQGREDAEMLVEKEAE